MTPLPGPAAVARHQSVKGIAAYRAVMRSPAPGRTTVHARTAPVPAAQSTPVMRSNRLEYAT